ncbi:uncharacterized protein DUF4229 [Micromonospora pisi]|uniref:Uncharacterized protein DUF4229 n=1 Tax=Micromonospora pisi TaxID=589240 RepID=A0A495JNU1_9ACTN|nr:DUF4229 domain-containing protein [Micromonospora pisi]RKR89709.1 uncharacterized protein DUF4229 [Micromonospora pisi]
MSPAVKYTLGRIGLFLVVAAALLPVPMNIFLKLMLAVVFSAAASFFLLRTWRDQMAEQVAGAVQRRQAEKQRLRAALSGEDEASEAPVSPAGPVPTNPPTTDADGGPATR